MVIYLTEDPDTYTTLRHIPKHCATMPQGHLFNYIPRSFIHKSQKQETTQMTLKQRMDEENVVYLHNGILLIYQKQGHNEIFK